MSSEKNKLSVERIYPLIGEMCVQYEHLFYHVRALPESLFMQITFERVSDEIRDFLFDFVHFNQRLINSEDDAIKYMKYLLKILLFHQLIENDKEESLKKWFKELEEIKIKRNIIIHSNYIRSPFIRDIKSYRFNEKKPDKHSSRAVKIDVVKEQDISDLIVRIEAAFHGLALLQCSVKMKVANPPASP